MLISILKTCNLELDTPALTRNTTIYVHLKYLIKSTNLAINSSLNNVYT